MKHYLLSIQQPDGGPPPPEVLDPIMRDVQVVNRELRDAGLWVFGGGLRWAEEAVVARPQGEEVLLTDGPYTEGKEHVGGLTVIRSPNLETAKEWGRKLAHALTIPVEVREFQGDPTQHRA